ncbi:MAG TPA: ABC transporter permease [Dongiaceae bacterium]|jgi:ABC-2 type transport system permease protein|nr:ABC transporter permease [Dongiaceae bacterium]
MASRTVSGATVDFLVQVFAIADAEFRKLRHDPIELATRAVQPMLWLLLFGQVMAQIRGLSGGSGKYLDFLSAGILAQSVLFTAIFYGISAIWERDLGILHRYLVSPAARPALVLGKALSAAVRGFSQAVIIYALALVLGIGVSLLPSHIVGAILFVALGSILFSTLSLIMACLVKTRERFMGIGQVMTMPIFFASNAIYPISLMPHWLQNIASLNPLTYEVDALRALMLQGGASVYGLASDAGILIATSAVLVVIAAKLYPRMVI